MLRHLIPLFVFCICSESFSQEPVPIGKVTWLRGDVRAFIGKAKTFKFLKRGSAVYNNHTIYTEKKSVVRITLNNGHQTTLGPKSRITLAHFGQKKPGVIDLAKGQIRALVSPGRDKKTKLYIKTKTAAMGVRGTELHVVHNHLSDKSTLLTYSGSVKMIPFQSKFDPELIESKLNSSEAVEVVPGHLSFAEMKQKMVTNPVPISRAQFKVLKNQTVITNLTAPPKQQRGKTNRFKNPLPIGVNPRLFSNRILLAKKNREVNIADDFKSPISGGVDPKTGQITPVSGGFFDLGTGAYIPPNPRTSYYDANTDTFVPSQEMGKFDPETGHYLAPPDKKLEDDGSQLVQKESGKVIDKFDIVHTGNKIKNKFIPPQSGPGGPSGPNIASNTPGPNFGVPGAPGELPEIENENFNDIENDIINEGQNPQPPPNGQNFSVVQINIIL
jgi:hypothetical protein